jgi:hypothetical protein
MSAHWNEFDRRVDSWRQAGDYERLKMVELYHEAIRHRETNPEYVFELFTRGRSEAQRLSEPWWVLFFEYWRLSTVTADLHDFASALPLAMELMVRFNTPEGLAHPQRVNILTSVLYTYLQVDPIGYRDELESGFAHLDGQITRGPRVERFVLDYRRTEYLRETERWDEAFDLALESLALADRSGNPDIQIWHGAWSLFILCQICDALGRLDQLAGHAEDMAERSRKKSHLIRTRASALLWIAVARRATGDERTASRSFHIGLQHLKNLDSRDEICADPIARYYELGGDYNAAVGVRDRELAVITKKGMLHRSCRVQIERCRLLSRAGGITPSDVTEAHQAAAKLRVPNWYLEKLARFEAP